MFAGLQPPYASALMGKMLGAEVCYTHPRGVSARKLMFTHEEGRRASSAMEEKYSPAQSPCPKKEKCLVLELKRRNKSE